MQYFSVKLYGLFAPKAGLWGRLLAHEENGTILYRRLRG